MKKILATFIFGLSASCAMAAAPQPTTDVDFPSFGFVQEMAGVLSNGTVSVNLYDSLGPYSRNDIRIGAFGGEILLDPSTGTTTSTGVGYKHPLSNSMALYGKLYLDTTTGAEYTNFTFGFSYTGMTGSFLYNGNAELFNCSDCGAGATSETFTNLRLAGFYQLQQKAMAGRVQLGLEADLRMAPSPTNTSLFLGMRWIPKSNVMLDLGLLSDDGTTSTVASPAFVRLNVSF